MFITRKGHSQMKRPRNEITRVIESHTADVYFLNTSTKTVETERVTVYGVIPDDESKRLKAYAAAATHDGKPLYFDAEENEKKLYSITYTAFIENATIIEEEN